MYISNPYEKYDTAITKCPHEQKFTKMQIIRIAFTRLNDTVISYRVYMKVQFMLIKYTSNSITHALPVEVYRQTDFTPKRVVVSRYMQPLRNFVPECRSRSGTTTGVNSRQCDSRRYGILCWYRVNKYRATRGNRSELAPARTSPRCHVNTPIRSIVKTEGKLVK